MCCCESKPQKRQLIRLRGYFSCAPGAKSPSKYAEPRAPPPWPRTPRAARRRAGPRPPCRLGSWLQRRFWKRTPRLSLPLAPRRGLARWRDCHLGFRPPRPGTARGSAVGEAGGPGGGRQAACNVCSALGRAFWSPLRRKRATEEPCPRVSAPSLGDRPLHRHTPCHACPAPFPRLGAGLARFHLVSETPLTPPEQTGPACAGSAFQPRKGSQTDALPEPEDERERRTRTRADGRRGPVGVGGPARRETAPEIGEARRGHGGPSGHAERGGPDVLRAQT